MASYINTNMASLNAQRNLTSSQSTLATSLQRLSSGLRINSAKDDAAGLAISDRMTSQINGLNQAARNANDGISLAQTAEGALSSIGDNLQRIRTLALQSANSTNSASDRSALNAEVQSALSEISRVAGTTQFNGLNLLDGSFQNSQFQVGANANQTISISISGATTSQIGAYQQKGTAVTSAAFTGANFSITAAGATSATNIGVSVATGTAGNNYVSADSAAAKAAAINAKTAEHGVTATASTSLTGNGPTVNNGIASGQLMINGVAIGAIGGASTAAVQGQNAADAINARTSLTGVSASADKTTGALTLSAADGRNIEIKSSDGAAGTITDIQSATGLLAGDSGSASGQDSMTLQVGGAFDMSSPAAGSLTAGDTFDLDGVTYELYDSAGSYSGSNVGIGVADGANATTTAQAIKTAINAQFTAGNTNVQATGSGDTLTITNKKLGAQGTFASYDESGVAGGGGATALVQTSVTTGTSATADADGATTRGTLVLSSGTGFTVGGSAAAAAGLSNGSALLTSLSTADISTVSGANQAISLVDGALAQVDAQRANLGAVQNRFSSAVSNLQTSSENISAARSRVQDTDFAAETASLTRAQILQQAGTAMLAQANSLPNGVLSLLRGG